MSEQHQHQDQEELTSAMHKLMAQMAQMQAELNILKERANIVTPPQNQSELPVKPVVSTTRRKALRRLAGGLLAGVGMVGVAASLPEQAEAKLVAKPGRIGAIVTPNGDSTSNDLTGTGFNYGLLALSGTGNFDLSHDGTPSPANRAIVGISSGSDSTGVYGFSDNYGVYGTGTYGVSGIGLTYGVYGTGESGVYGTGGYGVEGLGSTGVYGTGIDTGSNSTGSTGVYGIGNGTNSTGVKGTGNTYGVYGQGTGSGPSAGYGVYGAGGYTGVYAVNSQSPNPQDPRRVFLATQALAGDFYGDVSIHGTLIKTGGSFKIDHPLDPANKYLSHSFVESPDMMNIYNGLVSLNDQGEAIVEMPSWFEALNSDYRYGLTSIGRASPNLHIAQKIDNGKFNIGGGLPGQEVSWMVTGIRQDTWAKAHRIPVEEEKPLEEKGFYLHPTLFGVSEARQVGPKTLPNQKG